MVLAILRNLGDVLTGQVPFFSPLLIIGEFEWWFFTVNLLKPYTERQVEVGECTEELQTGSPSSAAYHSFSPFPTVYFHILPLLSKQERKSMINTMLIGASM